MKTAESLQGCQICIFSQSCMHAGVETTRGRRLGTTDICECGLVLVEGEGRLYLLSEPLSQGFHRMLCGSVKS